ncbi:hypothetical protein G7Y89_g12385 [Cudoniella acicularis]|uniref:Uncharacterized protein n=1 Tax=Cudoniella acicularis TaxID=354080 RepID=A0A8H4RBM1_9HELO|nr:hypothetical protein G7Y89_g12385 [Cudoniella acicularis]
MLLIQFAITSEMAKGPLNLRLKFQTYHCTANADPQTRTGSAYARNTSTGLAQRANIDPPKQLDHALGSARPGYFEQGPAAVGHGPWKMEVLETS